MNVECYQIRLATAPDDQQWRSIAKGEVYPRVFRTDFEVPGFALISFQSPLSSFELRHAMWALKSVLSDWHEQVSGERLFYLSMGRFDSQNTTKLHLDGAPEQSFLMLGYEPSLVRSELFVADYSKAAHDWNITPQELLEKFNPMFGTNEQRLLPYVTRLQAFDPAHAHILLLNNSSQPFAEASQNLLGVMHGATIVSDSSATRIINSTMITTSRCVAKEAINEAAMHGFLNTNEFA